MHTQQQSSAAADTAADTILRYPSRFGDVELREDRLIAFDEGILGFGDCTVFGLSRMPDNENSPLMLLQCVNDPKVCFLVADPEMLGLRIAVEHREQARQEAGMSAEDTQFLVILTLYDQGDSYYLTANLKAPILIDSASRKGRQQVLLSSEYTTQHKL